MKCASAGKLRCVRIGRHIRIPIDAIELLTRPMAPYPEFETPPGAIAMNATVLQDFTDYLALVDGDKAAAASLAMAAALCDCWPAAAAEPASPSGALTAAEAANTLRVSPWTIYRLARIGKLPSYRAGSALRFTLDESSVLRKKAGRPQRRRPSRCSPVSSGTTASRAAAQGGSTASRSVKRFDASGNHGLSLRTILSQADESALLRVFAGGSQGCPCLSLGGRARKVIAPTSRFRRQTNTSIIAILHNGGEVHRRPYAGRQPIPCHTDSCAEIRGIPTLFPDHRGMGVGQQPPAHPQSGRNHGFPCVDKTIE